MHTTLSDQELHGWLRLSLEHGLGATQARNLLAAVGLPHDIFALSTSALAKFVPHDLARQLSGPPSDDIQATITATLKWLEQPPHSVVTLADPHYPQSLLDTYDPPLLFYINGDVGCLARPIIAIVGARNASASGTDNATAFARHLAQKGWCIASGLALGIDAAAHRGALLAGTAGAGTIAVMATGIDMIYPAKNRDLAHQIAGNGALVSEFPLGTHALPYQFPKRNRIVAGLARGVLVVEAARQSGSLITARLASEAGREVFAIPGSIHSPLSRGCHALIRQGAKLVESGQDIDEELNQSSFLPAPARTAVSPRVTVAKTKAQHIRTSDTTEATDINNHAENSPVQFSPSQAVVLDALGYDPVDTDILCARTKFDLPLLNQCLLELELDDVIARLADGRFQRR